ncbi:MAG: hypothetical protein NTV51_12840 [Verrucomicrobia bacterium]|nr:hypothetical protein [Verrucomicrobiota bacterium]
MARPNFTSVSELAGFREKALRLLSHDECVALVDYISINPKCGKEFEGTGGVRHLRWPNAQEKAQIAYYYCDRSLPPLLITATKIGEKSLLALAIRRLAAGA